MFLERIKDGALKFLYKPFGMHRKRIGPEVHYTYYDWRGKERHDVQRDGKIIRAERNGEIIFLPQ